MGSGRYIIHTLIYSMILFGIVLASTDTCLISDTGRSEKINATQICCNGTLLNKYISGLPQICCQNTLFSEMTYICCDENPVKVPDNKKVNDYSCCGTTPHLKGNNIGCCNGQSYNTEEMQCCSDDADDDNAKLHPLDGNKECCATEYYDYDTHFCDDDYVVMTKGRDMCGDVEYETENTKCCNQSLHKGYSEYDQTYICCGKNITNSNLYKCVNNPQPHIIPKDALECGEEYYYSKTQRCCRGHVLSVTKESEQCCGSELYDSSVEECCLPVQKGYDSSVKKCCTNRDGSKGTLTTKEEQCCGHLNFNPSSFVCCNASDGLNGDLYQIRRKSQDHHDSCCFNPRTNRTNTYFREFKRCIYGKEPEVEDRDDKCGIRKMNKTQDLCCNNELYRNAKTQDFQCCNAGNQICCNGVIFNYTETTNCTTLRTQNTTNNRDSMPEYTQGFPTEAVETTLPYETKPLTTNRRDNIGICNWCNMDVDSVVKNLISRKMNICKRTAIKLRKMNWFKDEGLTVLSGRVDKDIYDASRYSRKKRFTVSLPCSNCNIKTQNALIITNKQLKGGANNNVLDDADYVIPFSGQIKRLITSQCPLDVVNSMRVDMTYMLEKIERFRYILLKND